MLWLKTFCSLLVIGFLIPIHTGITTAQNSIVVHDTGKVVDVKIDGKLFTQYDYSSYKKPIFYPVNGPGQLSMTRNYPMKKMDGEANDHPHHKSVWLGHEINGIDFWSEKGGVVKLKSIVVDKSAAQFTAVHDWIDSQSGKTVVTDQLEVRFSGDAKRRIIDYLIQFTAPSSTVVFEDTKEGFFAVRVHPSLRHTADRKRGVSQVTGSMINSDGKTGKGIWGKKAKWVCYHGEINGNQCGVAMFDHPKNLRHPTTWHARDYGLLAANPFGVSYFQNAERGSGKFTISPGKKLNLQYRLLLFEGPADRDLLEQSFEEFSR